MAKHSSKNTTSRSSQQGTNVKPLIKAAPERPTEPTTRICIKNVPPSIQQAQQVKQFLFTSQQAYFPSVSLTITDCRILNKRRMAFVGFSSIDCASSCVEYLHNTYWKTTKIIVEFAFPPKETPKQVDQEVSKKERASSKTKTKNETSVEKKKIDFLHAIKASAPAKSGPRSFWSNDDDNNVGAAAALEEQQNNAEVHNDEDTNSDDNDSDESNDDEDSKDDAEPLFESNKGMSDMEFLRAKTVKVDELPEDEGSAPHQDDSVSNGADEVVDMEMVEAEDESKPENKSPDEPEEVSSKRLFVRNLPFSVTEDDLHEYFSRFGTLDECHVPVDDQHRSKGFGFVSFQDPDRSQPAKEECDGKDFQGRIIQVLHGRSARSSQASTTEPTTYKAKQEMDKQNRAGKDQTGWSASFVRGDAVVDNLASRLGLKKGDVLGVKDGLSAGDAAVRLALGETAVIEENRKYFAAHGIDMEALVSLPKDGQTTPQNMERSKTSILVKNLPADTAKDELLKSFGSAGVNPTRILLPPSRTIAVVEYAHTNEAKSAFKRLAYRRFRDVPLYLEWTPLAAQVSESAAGSDENVDLHHDQDIEESAVEDSLARAARPTLYVKNLNFSTSEDELRAFFSSVAKDIRAVRIPKKVAPAKSVAGKILREEKNVSMGFGFVEFGSKDGAAKAMEQLQGKMLDGHPLQLEPTKQSAQTSSSIVPKRKSSKLLIRNVPFQANRKELLTLFGSFGQLKKVRLPKKFDGNHRGFAFVDYVSSKEASEAMKSLSRTHLYGRHLVIEWAEDEETGVDTQTDAVQPKNKKIRFT